MPYRQHRATAGAPPWLTIETTASADGSLTTVRINGEVDRDSAAELVRSFGVALAGAAPHRIEADLSAVTFIDAAGVRALIVCRQLATDAGSRLRLIDPAPPVRTVLGIIGLSEDFGLSR